MRKTQRLLCIVSIVVAVPLVLWLISDAITGPETNGSTHSLDGEMLSAKTPKLVPPLPGASKRSDVEVLQTNPPDCRAAFWRMSRAAFHMNRVSGPVHSVECKVIAALQRALLRWCSSPDGTGPDAQRIAVDIGANDGSDISCFVRMLSSGPCAGKVRFTLFEPQMQYKASLEQVQAHLTQTSGVHIDVQMAGIGPDNRHNDTIRMVGDGSFGVANIDGRKHLRISKTHPERNKVTTIRLVSLPITLRSLGYSDTVRISFLKIDCEGADPTIIVANERLFRTNRVDLVMFEVNSMVKFFNTQYHSAAQVLESAGYRMFFVGASVDHLKLTLLETDTRLMSQWKPKLETVIAISPLALSEWGSTEANPFDTVAASIKSDPAEYLERFAPHLPVACVPAVFEIPCPLCDKDSTLPA